MQADTRPAIGFKWEWNVNTIAVLVGFASMFIAWGYTLAEIRTGREQNAANIERLTSEGISLRTQLDMFEKDMTKLEQAEWRMTAFEKGLENQDIRISRITESYSNQFSDFRTQLSAISTQIALTNQTLQRIEATPQTRAAPLAR